MIGRLQISTTPVQKAREDPSTEISPSTSLTDSSDSPISRRLFSGQGHASSVKNADDAAYRDGLSSETSDGETPNKRGIQRGLSGLDKRTNELLKDTQVGRRCVITRNSPALAVENAHVVAKATDPTSLSALEYAWGMNHMTFNANSRYNIVRLKNYLTMENLFSCPKNFLPEEKDVKAMIKLYRSKQRVHPSTQYPAVGVYRYQLVVNDELVQLPITRLVDPLPLDDKVNLYPDSVALHMFPFDQIPMLELTGQGMSPKHREAYLYADHNVRVSDRILECLDLWNIWRGSEPTSDFFNTPKKARGVEQKTKVTSLRRASSTGKRTRAVRRSQLAVVNVLLNISLFVDAAGTIPLDIDCHIMITRDPVLLSSHDFQRPSPSGRHRSRSSVSSRSLSSKRSPSPIISFSPTTISSESKGVKNITRKVIKTLEGLGHLDSTNMEEQEYESDEKCDIGEATEVAAALNGAALHHEIPETDVVPKKIDWEIPRKLLHSSIGFGTVYLYMSNGDVKTVSPGFERIYERCLGFLMRESEKKTSNGVIWYILGVNFVLTFYPLDVATVAILILSWADTAASTFGRLYGSQTRPLPPRTPILRLPLAPRKSFAGFIAAAITGAAIAFGFWGLLAPVRNDLTWTWDNGVLTSPSTSASILPALGIAGPGFAGAGGFLGLGAISMVAGVVSGVAEALDLGSLDDNLTLPIISGGCILGFLKFLGLFSAPP
ncbi:CTP-dependent diacylglycerol kinase 1 [Termitomyces sp. J132]|nr:CTP-dependent diacylglycerol kinase 1 [Termitomyces sp. J132]